VIFKDALSIPFSTSKRMQNATNHRNFLVRVLANENSLKEDIEVCFQRRAHVLMEPLHVSDDDEVVPNDDWVGKLTFSGLDDVRHQPLDVRIVRLSVHMIIEDYVIRIDVASTNTVSHSTDVTKTAHNENGMNTGKLTEFLTPGFLPTPRKTLEPP
jgi:hypothetical protein